MKKQILILFQQNFGEDMNKRSILIIIMLLLPFRIYMIRL